MMSRQGIVVLHLAKSKPSSRKRRKRTGWHRGCAFGDGATHRFLNRFGNRFGVRFGVRFGNQFLNRFGNRNEVDSLPETDRQKLRQALKSPPYKYQEIIETIDRTGNPGCRSAQGSPLQGARRKARKR